MGDDEKFIPLSTGSLHGRKILQRVIRMLNILPIIMWMVIR